jgi:tight adherence protein C
MTILFLASAAITVFVLVATVIVVFGGDDRVDRRLMEVAAKHSAALIETREAGLAAVAASVTNLFKPIRDLISGTDEDMGYRLTLAGFRRPEHVEVYTSLKMLLPVVGVVFGTFFGGNLIVAILLGAILGFFGPDLALTHLITRRQQVLSRALPDALDLLVICMEAGLGIDQAMARVGAEMRLTSPALADEFQIIMREQRAGKLRVEAWRSMADRVNVTFINQFVSMLVQTERFGTPIAHALGQFADTLRIRRTQAAEEIAAKTGAKLLFPLIIFIFPSLFVVSIGPAILGVQNLFHH